MRRLTVMRAVSLSPARMSSSGYLASALGSGAVSVKANAPRAMASNTPTMIGTLIMLAVGKVSSARMAAVAPVRRCRT